MASWTVGHLSAGQDRNTGLLSWPRSKQRCGSGWSLPLRPLPLDMQATQLLPAGVDCEQASRDSSLSFTRIASDGGLLWIVKQGENAEIVDDTHRSCRWNNHDGLFVSFFMHAPAVAHVFRQHTQRTDTKQCSFQRLRIQSLLEPPQSVKYEKAWWLVE